MATAWLLFFFLFVLMVFFVSEFREGNFSLKLSSRRWRDNKVMMNV
jgi:hypothetical protein